MPDGTALQGFEEMGREDAIREAVLRLRRQMRRASDDPVRVDLLEDDLREGLNTADEVRAFFDDVLALLVNPDTRGRDLVDLADDPQVLDQLDYLVVVVNNLRRRLMQLAARSGS
ncbi:MAG: hypothetical protein HY901_08360 [Deltaproteobacteria bacterium]|nr:hypothetical protein [Deltaproteobacteria bacterium]